MTALERSLTCGLLASEIDMVNGVLHTGVDDSAILDFALENKFSHIPLADSIDNDSYAISHYAEVDLESNNVLERRAIEIQEVIAGSTPIGLAPSLFSNRLFLFVMEAEKIRYILTPSDLNGLPMRTYLHTVLDHLEGLMADCIDRQWRNHRNKWLDSLSSNRARAVQELYKAKCDRDFATRRIDCTSLSDKANIFGKTPELRGKLGYSSSNKFHADFKNIIKERNRLNHGCQLDFQDLRDSLRHAGPIIVNKNEISWLNTLIQVLQTWIENLSKGSS